MDTAIPSSSKLVRIKAAAIRLGVSPRTVHRIIAQGELLKVRIRGCSCLKEDDLTAYIEKNQQKER